LNVASACIAPSKGRGPSGGLALLALSGCGGKDSERASSDKSDERGDQTRHSFDMDPFC
jgi:hypothetical protein